MSLSLRDTGAVTVVAFSIHFFFRVNVVKDRLLLSKRGRGIISYKDLMEGPKS